MSPSCGPDASVAAQVSDPSQTAGAVAALRGASHRLTKTAGKMRANSISALAISKAGKVGQVTKYQATMVALASVTLFFAADSALRSVFVAKGFVFPSSLAGESFSLLAGMHTTAL